MQSYLQHKHITRKAERQRVLKTQCKTGLRQSGLEASQSTSSSEDAREQRSNGNEERDIGSKAEKHYPDDRQNNQSNATQATASQDDITLAEVTKAETEKQSEEPVDEFLVDWEDETDSDNPRNWSYTKRFNVTLLIVCIRFIVGFASSIDSSARDTVATEFGVARVVESIATGNFLFGLAVGAMLAGPLSEAFGRNVVYITTLSMSLIWTMASALAPNIGSQLAFRFLTGLFAATPLVCAGGSISDLWDAKERTISFVLFATVSFSGPVAGPFIGGWIVQSPYLSWRWTEWITLIIWGLITCAAILLLPETFAPVLLRWKAEHLRKTTGDSRYQTKAERDSSDGSTMEMLQTSLTRPFILVVKERIILLFTIYLTVIYIVLYTFFGGYQNIFGDTYGLSQGLIGTCFLGIFVGLCIVWLLVPIVYHLQNRELKVDKDDGSPTFRPELRLWFSMLGGAIAIPVGLFWMGWTASPSISIASPLIASVVFGYGILCVWITAYQYIIDSYEGYSASALAAMTTIRYACAGGMTIVGVPFYDNLGVHYTLTILGALSALMVPIPYMFYIWGEDIRAKSKFAGSVS